MKPLAKYVSHIVTFFLLFFSGLFSFAAPARTTYQAKIVKPDGYPLEASSVNFKFTILDPSGNCILYSETYSAVNMNSTGGLISFSLGSGVKTYPASATTFAEVFSNVTPNLSCDTGGPVSYTPSASDIRKIVMQFHDGTGWQTLPAMNINAVPYAMYADEAIRLSGLSANDFVQISTLPSCAVSEALRYTGAGFLCVAVGSNTTSGSVITALGYTPADSANLNTLSGTVTSVSSTVFSVSSTVAGLNSTVSSLSSTLSSVSATVASITSSQWATSGSTISYTAGSVGIGTQSPSGTIHASGSLPFYFDRAATNPAHIVLRSAGGSPGALVARASGEQLGQISFGGFDGSVFRSNDTGVIGIAAENWTGANNNGSELLFKTKSIGIAGNAAARMKISEAGNVGIGTTAPTAKLHLAGGTSSTPTLKLSSSTLVATPQAGAFEYDGSAFYFTDDAGTRRSVATTAASGTYDNATNITASGNINLSPTGSVVVSSTTASTNSQTGALVVAGGLGVSGNIYSSGTIITSSNIQGASVTATTAMITPIIYGGTGISNNLRLESTTHATKGYILMAQGSSGGNVGIGTTAPLAKLYVDSDGYSPNTPPAGTVAVFDNESANMGISLMTSLNRKASMFFGYTGSPSQGAINYHLNPTATLDKITFDVNQQERMVLTASATLGIGTSAPTAVVHALNSNPTQDILTVKGAASQVGAWFRATDSTNVTRVSIMPNGTMPQLQLGVSDAIRLTAEYGGINEIPSGGALNGPGNLSLFNSNGTNGSKVMAGYYNGTNFYSAWEFANVGSGFSNLLLMKSGGNVGVGTTAPSAKLHVANGEIDISNLNVLKNRYGYHFDQGNDATLYYHRLGHVSFNDGDLHIHGSVSGHDSLQQGKAIVDIFINARNAPYANGAVYGDLMGSNIEVYEDGSGNLDVYLTTSLYSQINLDIAAAGNANTYAVNEAKTTTTPSGTLVYNLKDQSKFNVKNNSYVGIGVSEPSTRLHVGDYLANAHMETNTKLLISGVDSYLQIQGDDANGSFATGIILTNVPSGTTTNKHWGISHRTPAASGALTFGYGTSTASTTLLSNTVTLMSLTTSGSLGLGILSPTINDASGTALHIHNANGRAAGIRFTTSSTGTTASDGLVIGKWTDGAQYGDGPIIWNYENTPMSFATSATIRLYISNAGGLASGFIGINNEAPTYNLDVSGTLRVSGQAYTNTGNGSFQILSDVRYKDVHGSYNRGLQDLLKIETIRYNYKKENPMGSDPTREYVGVSAQNLKKAIPEAIEVRKEKGKEYLTVNTSPVLWVMLNAVKELYQKVVESVSHNGEQDREIASLKEENKVKDQEIKELKKRLERIEQTLQAQPAQK